MIQLSKARLRTSLKIHNRNRTSRGETSARSARKQPTRGVSPLATDAASVHRNSRCNGDTAMAMSQENMETVRRFTEALVRKDYAAAAAELDPKLEIDDTDIPESTGSDSFYAWLARWDEAWEGWRLEDLTIRPVGAHRTISLFKMIAKGK